MKIDRKPTSFIQTLLLISALVVSGCSAGDSEMPQPVSKPKASRRKAAQTETQPQLVTPAEVLEPRQLLSSQPLINGVSGALAAYGLRQLTPEYTDEIIEVRRATDNLTTTIGFDGLGGLDLAALTAFAGLGDVYVTTWYDQSGGSADLVQANPSAQPLIVSAGNPVTDDAGLPRLLFDNSSLAAAGTPISNQNLTAFFVQQWSEGSDHDGLLALGQDKFHNHLQWFVSGFSGYIGDGGSWTGLDKGTSFTSNTPTLNSVQVLDANGQNVRFFRNLSLVRDLTHDKSQSVQSDFQIGSYSGHISEILLYPHLSETDRKTVFSNINAQYATGAPDPSAVNAGALLPQDWQFEVDLYDWLETITLDQVTTRFNQNPGSLNWDGTWGGTQEELASLVIHMDALQSSDSHIMTADPMWYVLDDGNGSGIEGSGELRLFHGQAPIAALWYSQDLTNADGSQGNPYYQDDALGRRALITAAVTLMKHIQQQDASSHWSQVDFIGGMLNGVVAPYAKFSHLLDARTQAAFEEAFVYEARRILQMGAHGINSNMDTKAVAALAHIHQIVADPESKDIVLRAVKKILFGSETGTPQTTNAAGVGNGFGIYNGYSIVEGASPETTYNGVSLFYLSEAHSVTRDDPDWDFMDPVVKNLAEFMLYQTFRDPNGYWDGPSGYAGRTGGSFVHGDQRDTVWRDLYAAATFPEAEAMAWGVKYGGAPIIALTPAELSNSIQNSINWANGHGPVTDHSGETAPTMPSVLHWPEDNVYLPVPGWYDKVKALLQNAADPNELYPFQGPDSFSRTFENDFWAYKNSDGGKDFGFFVESLAHPGEYSGWYGGSLQTFWTRETGMVFLARHDKSGNEANKNENTRVWSQINTWATHHIWGRDESGRAFSTAATDGVSHSVTYDLAAANPAVAVSATLGSATKKGQQTGAELQGQATFTNQFRALGDGLEITQTITSDGSDELTQLWASLPVFLRDTDQNMQDATIEYWNGNAWQTLNTTLASTQKLRIGRDFGNGPNYVYVHFDQPQRVKLSAAVWVQSYQGNSRIRNLEIDLHGNPGTTRKFAQSTTLRYAINTNENHAPGLSVGDRSFSYKQNPLSIVLPQTDQDGETLTYTAFVVGGSGDVVAESAYALDQTFDFQAFAGSETNNYWYNARGYGEKYLSGYFILPDGRLYRWGGSIPSSTLVNTLDSRYHADPGLLVDAADPAGFPITASLSGSTLTITPPNSFLGSFDVTVSVTDGLFTESETFTVSVSNSTPVLSPIGDQAVAADSALTLNLSATDADADALTFSATAVQSDPVAQLALQLDQQYDFQMISGSIENDFWYNARGHGERYLSGYFLLPGGKLYKWGGSIEASKLIATLDDRYHQNPALLVNAPSGTGTPVAASISGSTLTVTPPVGFEGDIAVTVSVTDGNTTDSETFILAVGNRPPALEPVSNQSMTQGGTLDVDLNAADADGDALTFSASAQAHDPVADQAYTLDQQHDFQLIPGSAQNNYWYNARGYGEKYLSGYFIFPNGELYKWGGSIATSVLIGRLDSRYHDDPSVLVDAQPPQAPNVSFSFSGSTLKITPPADFVGSFQVTIVVSDGEDSDTETFLVTVEKSGAGTLDSAFADLDASML